MSRPSDRPLRRLPNLGGRKATLERCGSRTLILGKSAENAIDLATLVARAMGVS